MNSRGVHLRKGALRSAVNIKNGEGYYLNSSIMPLLKRVAAKISVGLCVISLSLLTFSQETYASEYDTATQGGPASATVAAAGQAQRDAIVAGPVSVTAVPAGVYVISTAAEFKAAVQSAQAGDTIYVGDIDFTAPGDVANSWMRVEIDKNLNIVGVKTGDGTVEPGGVNEPGADAGSDGAGAGGTVDDGNVPDSAERAANAKAVLRNAGFILSGSKVSGEGITVTFENIIFDGGVDTKNLAFSDFDWPYDEASGQYIMEEARLAQQAVSFAGNVDAGFSGCEFRNYMNEYGPVMSIHYGDYSTIPSLLEMFGDYSGCRLNITLDDCRVADNAACYDGGAIYIEAKENVTLTARNTEFSGNMSGGGEFCMGGGAIYVQDAAVLLDGCVIRSNEANHEYPGMNFPETDSIRGGGIFVNNAELFLYDSIIEENKASMGGGLALTNAKADIQGCVFRNNRAETTVQSPYGDTGPWTNMGQGGAIYHEGMNGATARIINSSIYGNFAQTAYGGVYSYYNPAFEDMDVCYLELVLCSYAENWCEATAEGAGYDDEEIIPWCNRAGNIWEIPYVTATSCVIIDDELRIGTLDSIYTEDGLVLVLDEETGHFDTVLPEGLDFSILEEANELLASMTIGERYELIAESDGGRLNGLRLTIGDNYNVIVDFYRSGLGNEDGNSAGDGIGDGAGTGDVEGNGAGDGAGTADGNGTGDGPGTADGSAGGDESVASRMGMYIFIGLGVALVVLAIALTILYFHAQANVKDRDGMIYELKDKKEQFVRAWFTRDEIDSAFKAIPKVQTLTPREVDVLWEILEGKKQKEVAYDLGIEVTTVKDYYRKIYDKLDVSNKDELMKAFSEAVEKKQVH